MSSRDLFVRTLAVGAAVVLTLILVLAILAGLNYAHPCPRPTMAAPTAGRGSLYGGRGFPQHHTFPLGTCQESHEGTI